MSVEKKSKFDEMDKAKKVCYCGEMKDYGPTKRGKRDPMPPKGHHLDSSCCLECCLTIKSPNPGISIGDVAKKLRKIKNSR